jgi:hypothetical protein
MTNVRDRRRDEPRVDRVAREEGSPSSETEVTEQAEECRRKWCYGEKMKKLAWVMSPDEHQ